MAPRAPIRQHPAWPAPAGYPERPRQRRRQTPPSVAAATVGRGRRHALAVGAGEEVPPQRRRPPVPRLSPSCWPLRAVCASCCGTRGPCQLQHRAPGGAPSQTAPARRRASVSAGTAARRDLAEAPPPGVPPAAVYFQGTDSRAVTWNLASRCSNKCFRRAWSQKLFRWTSN